jgi:TfoX/Sxy family transcriptional regulator of competence genes
MAYDEELAHRVRAVVGREPGITEKAMFGGLAFLQNGNMTVVVRGKGGLMVRVAAEDYERRLADRGAQPAVMRGRPMTGWVVVDPDELAKPADLRRWVNHGLAYGRTLPPK